MSEASQAGPVVEGEDAVAAPANPMEGATVIPNSPEVASLGMDAGIHRVPHQPVSPPHWNEPIRDLYEKPEDFIGELFKYHKPEEDQVPRYNAVREGALNFARIIERYVPAGADRSAAIRKLREAVMTANAAIALRGRT